MASSAFWMLSMPKVVRTDDGAPKLNLYSVPADEPAGTIGIPVRDHLNASTVTALITTALTPGSLQGDRSVDVNIVQGSILTAQRNLLVQRMRGDWLLFIDDDMVWQPQDLVRIIELRAQFDLDVLGGLCFQRSAPYQPTMYMRERKDGGAYNFLERWEPGSIVEVDATGLAFLVVHRRVFERIVRHVEDRPDWVMPPFEERIHQAPPNFFRWHGRYGEDLQFCQDARASGSSIYVATDLEIGHIAEVTITKRHFLMELAVREPAVLAQRRLVNDQLGLPTVEVADARRELGWDD